MLRHSVECLRNPLDPCVDSIQQSETNKNNRHEQGGEQDLEHRSPVKPTHRTYLKLIH